MEQTITAQSLHEAGEVSASSPLGFVTLLLEVLETELNLITLQFDQAILCGAATANPRFQLFQKGFQSHLDPTQDPGSP